MFQALSLSFPQESCNRHQGRKDRHLSDFLKILDITVHLVSCDQAPDPSVPRGRRVRSSRPTAPDFQFDISLEAAQHNWWTFESLERILKKVVASDPNSMMACGSEFTQHPRSNLGFAHYMVSVASLPEEGTTSSPPRTHGLRRKTNTALQPSSRTTPQEGTVQRQLTPPHRSGSQHSEVLEGVPLRHKRIQMEELAACRHDWALLRITLLVISLCQRNLTILIYTQKKSTGLEPTVVNTNRQARRWNAQLSVASYSLFQTRALPIALLEKTSIDTDPGESATCERMDPGDTTK
jgi:hypothetical protein